MLGQAPQSGMGMFLAYQTDTVRLYAVAEEPRGGGGQRGTARGGERWAAEPSVNSLEHGTLCLHPLRVCERPATARVGATRRGLTDVHYTAIIETRADATGALSKNKSVL